MGWDIVNESKLSCGCIVTTHEHDFFQLEMKVYRTVKNAKRNMIKKLKKGKNGKKKWNIKYRFFMN